MRTATKNEVCTQTKHRKDMTQNTSGKTTTLRNQCSSRRKEIEVDSIKVEILTKEERTKHLGQIVTFQQQETTDIKKSNQGCLGDILQIQARVGLQILHSPAQASLVRHGDHTNYELRLRTWTLSKEHESLTQLTQRKMLRCILQTRRKYTKKTHDKK